MTLVDQNKALKTKYIETLASKHSICTLLVLIQWNIESAWGHVACMPLPGDYATLSHIQ